METMKVGYETSLNEYIQQERTAVKLTNSIGHLMFEKGVKTKYTSAIKYEITYMILGDNFLNML